MAAITTTISPEQENAILTVLSVTEVAEYLSVGKNRIYELLNTGTLKDFGWDLHGRLAGWLWKLTLWILQNYKK